MGNDWAAMETMLKSDAKHEGLNQLSSSGVVDDDDTNNAAAAEKTTDATEEKAIKESMPKSKYYMIDRKMQLLLLKGRLLLPKLQHRL
eukprot:7591227-Ditylum_brightwellii.AAC.1